MAKCFYCGWDGDGHYDGCITHTDSALTAAQARIEELERMVVFLSDDQDAVVIEGDMFIGDNFYPCDGTPASILAAVAKAMKP